MTSHLIHPVFQGLSRYTYYIVKIEGRRRTYLAKFDTAEEAQAALTAI
jgi:hypothetical protein